MSAELTNILLAFLFVFAVVYGVIIKSKLFEGQKGVNLVIALVLAFFSVMYEPLVTTLVSIMPVAVGVFLVLFGVLMVFNLIKGQTHEDVAPNLAVLAVLFLLLFYTQQFVDLEFSEDLIWGVGIFLVVAMLWLGYKAS